MPSEIHAILFNKDKYDVNKAREFLKKHKYKPKFRVQKSDKYLRYTMTDAVKNGIYRTINFGKDIKAVVEFKQKGGKASTRIQAIIFEKENFTSDIARKWLSENGYTPIKRVDKTKNFLRYRLVEPRKGAMYRMIDFGDDIKAVLEILKPIK